MDAEILKNVRSALTPGEMDNPALSRTSESNCSVFSYVECVGEGCDGWINLFHGDNILCLITDVALASRIKETAFARKQNSELYGNVPPK